MKSVDVFELSGEQAEFVRLAKTGCNILVDACIGSGKTTAIQHLCNELSSELKILYLTYNRLLKVDAKNKIKKKNVTVTNYHGFAYNTLMKANIKGAGVSDIVQVFNKHKPTIEKYDVLIIDEYQDIEQEFADLLEYIKSNNPSMQILAVGDMAQKIYDKTTLNVESFIGSFLGDYKKIEFTKCFRLSADLAAMLGRVWGKDIVGVNDGCIVQEMEKEEVLKFLSQQETGDILCLGKRDKGLSELLNRLEKEYSEKFNKKTVYASIRDSDGNIEPSKKSAIFTTFDSSKGMERPICVIFDFDEKYWSDRISMPRQSYDILRNIFCVAASRGKEKIIFVKSGNAFLSEKTLSTKVQIASFDGKQLDISDMFDFKYKEDVEKCFSLLKIKSLTKEKDRKVIDVKNKDALIDLSPCIGIYQETAFFNDYDIDKQIEFALLIDKSKRYLYQENDKNSGIEEKVLILTAIETKQDRYKVQVKPPFITEREKGKIMERLSSKLSRDENVQKRCGIFFSDKDGGDVKIRALGMIDVFKKETVYELKFVGELRHEHYLQCACYMVAVGVKKGVLWNVRDNSRYQIKVPNEEAFLDAVVRTITKGQINKYYKPKRSVYGLLRGN